MATPPITTGKRGKELDLLVSSFFLKMLECRGRVGMEEGCNDVEGAMVIVGEDDGEEEGESDFVGLEEERADGLEEERVDGLEEGEEDK